MLRAIAGYFFGGAEGDASSAALDCETREVNDWLVVTMPDQPVDDVDIDDAVDEDDVLLSLSILMNADGNNPVHDHYSESFLEVDDPSDDSEDSDSSSVGSSLEEPYDAFPTENWKEDYFHSEEVVESFVPEVPFKPYYNCLPTPFFGNLDMLRVTSPPTVAASLKQYTQIVNYFRDITRDGYALEVSTIDNCMTVLRAKYSRTEVETPKQYQKGRELLQRLKSVKNKVVRNSNATTCHPVYSKTYVNHCHPALPPKTDVLQRIKELDNEQKASERSCKKHISKGQMNRQNKNYIYDTSSKKNRRKNLQRNPSGANNNRKCY